MDKVLFHPSDLRFNCTISIAFTRPDFIRIEEEARQQRITAGELIRRRLGVISAARKKEIVKFIKQQDNV